MHPPSPLGQLLEQRLSPDPVESLRPAGRRRHRRRRHPVPVELLSAFKVSSWMDLLRRGSGSL